MTKDEIFMYHLWQPSKNKIGRFEFNKKDPFFQLYETSWFLLNETSKKHWIELLDRSGLFEHKLTTSKMFNLEHYLKSGGNGMDRYEENDRPMNYNDDAIR